MAIPSTTQSLNTALGQIQGMAGGQKSAATTWLADLQRGPVNSDWVFIAIGQMTSYINQMNTLATTPGLNTYATENLANYSGTMTADIAASTSAAQACNNWVVANFPTDAGGFIQAYKLNPDGTRVPTNFTTAQTTGLQSALQTFIATIA